MFGTKLNTVFKNRWRAVIWSAGVLLVAYCAVPAPEKAHSAEAKVAAAPHKSPWAY